MPAALDGVVERVVAAAAAGHLPIVVVDLDSTVIHTGPRHHAVLRDFVEARGHPELTAVAQQISADDFGYLVEGPLRARGFADEAVIEELRAFWRPRFFDGAYCVHDRARPGAVAFIERLVRAGALVYYLTARPVDMAHGTLTVLLREGFPCLRGRAVLHMKPARRLDDRRFKRAALREVRSLGGEVCASFENEPAHAAALLKAFPSAIHFLVGQVRSPTAPEPDPALVALDSFDG